MQFYGWLEDEIVNKKEATHTEYSVTKVLKDLRSKLELNMGLSFPAISAFKENACKIHYFPNEN